MIPRIKDECTGCGLCVEVCPPQAITIVDGKARINPDLCEECGVCVPECAVEALFLPWE